MAFTSTIDTRPTALGNLMLVTGTFTNDGGSTGSAIDLSDILSSIVACGANADATTPGTGAGVDGTFAFISGTNIAVQCVANQIGTWWALGQRS
tara:strand:- start:2343 stop:2624 length:282 start_codon:yes stop_codon:yes gene_type:complete